VERPLDSVIEDASGSSGRQVAVHCEGVTKEFGSGGTQVMALRGVDLDVYAGQMTLLVGPSGCGKTTLLSVIAGILEPTDGLVSVLGEDLGSLSSREIVRFRQRNIGFIFQQFNLLPALNAVENVAVPLIIAGVARRKAIRCAELVCEQVGLTDRMHAMPVDLSGGQQQRVAIARALVHEPALLVCDEPTSALDAVNGRLIMELLHDVALQPNRAVIVVTHDNRVFGFGNRIAYMEDGRIVRTAEQAVHRGAVAASH
jgi:putative ABC transport system ATP-binding protein